MSALGPNINLKKVVLMAVLILSVIMGAIGMGYLVYGRKQKHIPTFISAIGLFAAPYLTSNIYALILIAVLLILMPFFIDF